MKDAALQAHEAALRDGQLVLASSHDAIFSADLDGVLWIWSRGAEALYGRPANEVRGCHVELLFHPSELPRLLREIVPETLREGRCQVTVRQLGAGAEEILVELRCACLRDGGGAPIGWLGCGRDLTLQHRAEASVREAHQRLLEVSEKLIRAQENERRRIARELHDDLGQRLTVLAMSLDALQSELSESKTTAARLTRLHGEARGLVQDLSGLSYELHPVSFHQQDLLSLLKSYCGEMSARTHLEIELAFDSVDDIGSDLPPALRLGLLRIVQEALRNVLVHSGAGSARVTLACHGEELMLAIEDRGRGFEHPKTGGLGLLSMEERARLFGGELEIHSRPGKGTRVEVRAPLPKPPAPETESAAADEPPVRQIGPYVLLGRLGKGSMGVVYLAEQKEPVPRRVALKLLRTPMPEGKELLRFDVERRALGRMDHPNIARIYGAEVTEDGDPYLVMELIDGLPITEYCDQRRMGLKARLELFIATCRGVGHAHQKRIIHRDLKPTHVLVAEQAGLPVPKVIDFGIAKAMDHPLAGGTVALTGESLVGSPAYLSPEVLRGGEADIRSDIYALGVLLYEILVGEPPIVIDESSLVQSVKKLIEQGSFQRPSERWRSLDPAVKARRAECRGAEADSLGRKLRGDLDDIVTKTLAEEPERRYASTGELAADLERHLRHEPVLAGPPSRLYAFGKLVRRHRPWAVAAVLVLLAVAVGLLTTTWEAHRANREAATAEQVTRFMTEMFEASSPFADDVAEITVRDLLDRGAKKARQELTEQPEVRARLLSTLGTIYYYLGAFEEALPLLEESLTIQEELDGDALDRAMILRTIAAAYRELSHFEQAETRLLWALDLAESAVGPEHPEVGRVRRDLAYALRFLERLPEAREQAEHAVALFERAKDDLSEYEMAEVLLNLAMVANDQEDFDHAEKVLKRTLEIPRRTTFDQINHASTLGILANLYRDQGRLGLAEPLLLESLEIYEAHMDPESPFLINGITNLAILYSRIGRYEQAEKLFRRSVEIHGRMPEGRNLALVSTLTFLAEVYLQQGDLDRPEPLLQQALEVLEETVGLDHGWAVGVFGRLGQLHRERRDFAGAEPFFLEAIEIHSGEPMNSRVALYSTELGNLYCDMGKPELAALRLQGARAFFEARTEPAKSHEVDHAGLARVYLALGRMHELRGEPEAARAVWQRAVEQMRPLMSSEDLAPKRILAEALLRLGRVADATPLVAELRALGLRLPSLARLCRESGLPMDEVEGSSERS